MTRLRGSSIGGMVLGVAGLAAAIAAGFAGLPPAAAVPGQAAAASAKSNAEALIDEGRRTFRHDTFGDEAFWGGTPAPAPGDRGREARRRRSRRQPRGRARRGPQGRRGGAARARRRRDREGARSTSRTRRRQSRCSSSNAVVGVTRLLRQRAAGSRPWASSARSATRPSTIRSRPGSDRRLDGWANRDLERGRDRRARSRPLGLHRRCSASTTPRCARCSRAGARASSTRRCSSTARRSGPTARRPRR